MLFGFIVKIDVMNKYSRILLLGLACLPFMAQAESTPMEQAPKTKLNTKTIYGLYEKVSISAIDLKIEAKLDTGAQTASLSARDIRRFKRDGESWVEFYLAIDEAHDNKIELPLVRTSKIKRRSDDYDEEGDEETYTRRPVVHLPVCLGNQRHTIEVNLTDRSAFKFPLLIGSNALTQFGALVDVSENYVAGEPACKPSSQSSAE